MKYSIPILIFKDIMNVIIFWGWNNNWSNSTKFNIMRRWFDNFLVTYEYYYSPLLYIVEYTTHYWFRSQIPHGMSTPTITDSLATIIVTRHLYCFEKPARVCFVAQYNSLYFTPVLRYRNIHNVHNVVHSGFYKQCNVA